MTDTLMDKIRANRTFKLGDWKATERIVMGWLRTLPDATNIDPADMWDDIGLPLENDSDPYAEAREQTATVLEHLGYAWVRCPGTSICYMTLTA